MEEVRKNTNKAIYLADMGFVSFRDLAVMALKYMSDDQVADMLRANELIFEDDEDNEDNEE